MAGPLPNRDRLWGTVLVTFVAVQLAYLYVDLVVVSPPSPDAPIGELRSLVLDHASVMRWHILIPPIVFIGMLVPGSFAVRRRLKQTCPGASLWPDLVVTGAVLVTVTVILAEAFLAILGLVPADELSDSVLRSTVMANAFTVWVGGSLAIVLLAGSTSVALLQAQPPPRRLAWFGLTTAGFALIGALWLMSGRFDGPLFGLNMLSRAMFLAWVATTGIWLHRTGSANLSDAKPTTTTERVAPATP